MGVRVCTAIYYAVKQYSQVVKVFILALDVDMSALKLSSCLSRAMSFMSINATVRTFVTSFPRIRGKGMEGRIGSSSLVALSAKTAEGIAGSKSLMDSRGTARIVSGGDSPPKPAGERGDL